MYIEMTYKNMKRCSTSLIREIKIKIAKCNHTSVRMAKIKKNESTT